MVLLHAGQKGSQGVNLVDHLLDEGLDRVDGGD